jgi:hypothetical protein
MNHADTLPVFRLLQTLNLPIADHAVFGSGPLIVRGIVEATNDVDVLCRDEAWSMVCEMAAPQLLGGYGVHVVELFDGVITCGTEWAIGEFDTDVLIDTAELIEGIPFVRMQHVVAYKRIAGRPKDVEHLRLLSESGIDLGPAVAE